MQKIVYLSTNGHFYFLLTENRVRIFRQNTGSKLSETFVSVLVNKKASNMHIIICHL